MKYSFLIYTHAKRFSNLYATLDCLCKRERSLFIDEGSELLIISQNRLQSVINPVTPNIRVVELNLPVFNKAKMVNTSVNMAKGEIVVMLDGDRILPKGYFSDNLRSIKHGEIITTLNLYRLKQNYTSAQLLDASTVFDKVPDFRHVENIPGKKNAFSGNTIMYKNDFLSVGGMDETYENYGCTDLDMSVTCLKAGMNIIYKEDEELHLWHSFDMPKNKFLIINCKSVLKYCTKWNQPVPPFFLEILKDKNNMIMMQ